jgi:Tfp pilus assembly PilM family ATPase
MTAAANALADEVARHYRYWDTRRDEKDVRTTPVERVILTGGSANLKGLDDFIAGKVQAETVRGNIWQHINDFDNYIPPIDLRTSMQYATAVGLALRAISI